MSAQFDMMWQTTVTQTKGIVVPLIDIHVLEGVFSENEKRRIITGTAKAFGTVAGKAMQDNTSVRIHEVKSGNWGGADAVWTTESALKLKNDVPK